MQEHISEHFNREGLTVFLENVFVTFIDKTELENRKKRKLLDTHFKYQDDLGFKHS